MTVNSLRQDTSAWANARRTGRYCVSELAYGSAAAVMRSGPFVQAMRFLFLGFDGRDVQRCRLILGGPRTQPPRGAILPPGVGVANRRDRNGTDFRHTTPGPWFRYLREPASSFTSASATRSLAR